MDSKKQKPGTETDTKWYNSQTIKHNIDFWPLTSKTFSAMLIHMMNILPQVIESIYHADISRPVVPAKYVLTNEQRPTEWPENTLCLHRLLLTTAQPKQVQNATNNIGLQFFSVCDLCDCGRNCCSAAGRCFARCSERTGSCVILSTVAAAAVAGCRTSTALDVRKNRTSTWSSHVTEISTTTSSTTSPATRSYWSVCVTKWWWWWWWWWWYDSLYGHSRNNAVANRPTSFISFTYVSGRELHSLLFKTQWQRCAPVLSLWIQRVWDGTVCIRRARHARTLAGN